MYEGNHARSRKSAAFRPGAEVMQEKKEAYSNQNTMCNPQGLFFLIQAFGKTVDLRA